nr:hypothetical protein [Tanacetum cinerariifolium]
MTDYSLWEVIKNGNKVLKFHSYQDAKLLMEAIEKSQPNSPQLAKADSEKVDPDDLEEMDLHWEIAMLTIRTGKNLDMNGRRIGIVHSTAPKSSGSVVLHAYEERIKSGEARLKFKELMKLCAKLSDIVLDLEVTKTDQAKEIADLKKRVKRLKRKRRSRTSRMNLFKIGTSRRRSLGEEDASKQGRNLKQRGREFGRKTFPVETPIENALIAQDRIRGYDWSYQAQEEIPTNYAFMALTSSRSSSSSKSE